MVGTRLNHYQVLEKIGQGGMGEVFRATDTKLNRDVAIKVLPESFANNKERLIRFQREAELLASLNHPNIAGIHGLEEADDLHALVLELVEGEDLSQRIKRGPLPVEEALDVCKQIAEALEAAHEKGIIHRDLKPGNVKLTEDGRVKVLDFGLAKAAAPEASNASTTDSVSPTITADYTMPGTLLGTAAYMSPEQARGKPVDKRSDIWSFGCVLYECLTGKRMFKGEDTTETLASIIKGEPDWAALPQDTPPTIHLLLRKSLVKDRRHRTQDIGDARVDLEQAINDPSSSFIRLSDEALQETRGGTGIQRPVVAGLLLFAVALTWFLKPTPIVPEPPAPSPPRTLELFIPRSTSPGTDDYTETPLQYLRISPDGRKFCYINDEGVWFRWLDRTAPPTKLVSGEMRGTIWSPDSAQIAYFQGSILYRVPISGGTPRTICDTRGVIWPGTSGAWFDDGRIIFSPGLSPLFVVDSRGGNPEVLEPLGTGEKGLHGVARLGSSQSILFGLVRENESDTICVLTLEGERKEIYTSTDRALFGISYANAGYVLIGESGDTGQILALPFSLERLERTGAAIQIRSVGAQPTVSQNGSLLINLSKRGPLQMVWVDRTGQIIETVGSPVNGPRGPRLSPDGDRAVFSVSGVFDWNIWMTDLRRGANLTAIESAQMSIDPYWTADSRTIVFRRWYRGNPYIYSKNIDDLAPEQKLYDGFIFNLSPSGRYVIYADVIGEPIHYLEMGRPVEERALVANGTGVNSPRISPNDKLLAYRTETTRGNFLYIMDFPKFSNRQLLAADISAHIEWRPDGSELFYIDGEESALFSIPFSSDGQVAPGQTSKLFDLPQSVRATGFAASSDGEKFLMLQSVLPAPGELPPPSALLMDGWEPNAF